jgi:hypothetical protein
MDAAIANYPEQRWTLRSGILVIPQQPRGLALSGNMQSDSPLRLQRDNAEPQIGQRC